MTTRPSSPPRTGILSRLTRLKRLMQSHIRIRPTSRKWQTMVSLDPGPCPIDPCHAAALLAGRRERLELGVELTRTLDRHAMSRSVMPALALLERALNAKAGRGEARLSAPVLWDAINNINMLGDSWQGGGLPALRRRLSAALGLDDEDIDVLCASQESFRVEDARLSDFMQVMDEWSRAPDAGDDRLADPVTH